MVRRNQQDVRRCRSWPPASTTRESSSATSAPKRRSPANAPRANFSGSASTNRRPASWSASHSASASTHSRRSEEHTSELQSLMRISYAVFCLKKKTTKYNTHQMSSAHEHIQKKQH